MLTGALSIAFIMAASTGGEELGDAFPAETYTQEIRFRFESPKAAQAADFELLPLYNGHDRAISSRWDDNYPNDLEMRKRLDSRGVKATWYLNVAPFEVNPGAEEFLPIARQLLDNGHSIGGHSYSHPYITYASRNRMFEEMAATRVAWESMLDTPVLSYSFSYVDYRNGVEGDAVHADLVRLLERAGFYHAAEFKTFDDQLPSELILSMILPPENSDFETFRAATDWAMGPELREDYPGISHSMHAWYNTNRNPYGWDELERRLDYVNTFPDLWHCNHNQYAAYRYQFLHTKLDVLHEHETVRLRISRPVLRFLNDPIPLTLAVKGGHAFSVQCHTADITRPDRQVEGAALLNIAHDRNTAMPARIGRVENPTNRNSLSAEDFDADFPGVRTLLSASTAGFQIHIANHSASLLEDVCVTYRLPLMWQEGIKTVHAGTIDSGAAWKDAWPPTPRSVDAKYTYGTIYAVAQIDFKQDGEAGRLYATCTLATEPDSSFPKEGFVVMGPVDPIQFDLAALDASVAGAGIPETWTLADGSALHWRVNTDGPVDQELFDPEVVRTLGSWYQMESPLYLLRSVVQSKNEQPVAFRSSKDDLKRVYLNGEVVMEGQGVLREGDNELLAVYHCADKTGSPRHAGCWLRLANQETGERLDNIAFERPETGSIAAVNLKIALLQMLPDGNSQETNFLKADAFCRQAAELGADIALFPEMFNIGYTPFHGTDAAAIQEWQAQALGLDSEYVEHFRRLAKELDMAIGLTYLQAWEGAPRNALTLVNRHGEIVLTYAKIHTCDFANFEAVTTPGDDFHVAALDTSKGPVEVGAMICYDREFPESARILMLKGAEIILTPNACLLDDTRHNQFQSRALENSVAVFMTNYPAPLHGGRSVAYGPNGECLVKAGEEEGVVMASINLDYLRDYRKKSIWGNAYRRPHKYHALTDSSVAPIWERINGLGKPFEREQR